MICEVCGGVGLKRPRGACRWAVSMLNIPCPRCGGTGFQHCCEGDQPPAHDEQERALDELALMGQEWDREE
ncbi:UNVERIFIED_CONTAM: hypothetical protein BEN50_19085 [Euhalothece sp. KZN 001]